MSCVVKDNLPDIDELWIVPVACHKHRYSKLMAENSHRLEMCRIALSSEGKIRVSPFEIDNNLPGDTFSLMQVLGREYPQHAFSVVIGQDNANTIEDWYRWSDLIRSVPFIVIPRGGVPSKESWYLEFPHRYINQHGSYKSSSTDIRNLLHTCRTPNMPDVLKGILDEEVYKYILKHDLYTSRSIPKQFDAGNHYA